MKIIEDDKGSTKKRFLFSRLFAEIYYFFAIYLYAILIILGAALSIAVFLFFAELIFPQAVHIFNYSMTDKVFTELIADHKYHAAIAFMDSKKNLVEKSNDPYDFRQQLADCYVHTGDYPKALEQYRLLREWIDDEISREKAKGTADDMTQATVSRFKNYINLCFLREEYLIYLKMGDIANVRKYHGLIQAVHAATDWDHLEDLFGKEEKDRLNDVIDGKKLEDSFRLELIQGKYLTSPGEAIAEMEGYAAEVFKSEKFNTVYKLRVLNELIRMLIDSNRRVAARRYLELALQLVDSMGYNAVIYGQLGGLSEYCHQLNDVSDGRRLLKMYLYHIDDTYDKTDIEYILAHSKEFKYLEADNEWDMLTRQVIEASGAMRRQILNNFTGMTSAQREYFITQFRPLFSYANRLMESHPSDELATECFENNMFLRGLLLRSETSVANAIAAMGNPGLSGKYNRYIEASQELVSRQYVSGPGNYYARRRLESEISSLETEIANASRDFRRENEASGMSVSRLRRCLGSNEIAMMIVEGDKTVFALLMDSSGKVAYKTLGTKEQLARLTRTPGAVYVDSDAVNEMLGSIMPLLAGKDVYMSTSWIFNQMAFGALPTDNAGSIIADMARIHIVGSPTEIPAVKSAEPMRLAARNAVLWGGIDYGNSDSPGSGVSQSRGVMRGDILGRLPNSLSEVSQIAGLLLEKDNRVKVISGSSATERSFTGRSGKRDYILHVSTHGFFHDSGCFTNPMQNSGLLFADSQRYWATDSLVSSISDVDGILRADEIARLDLNGCRLVVLSACQTGLGEYNSEGVYGLQRAFKSAGARSILMSLWSVDDSATRELMVAFYNGLIDGRNPDDALAAAQNLLRRKGYSPDKWAAFVILN